LGKEVFSWLTVIGSGWKIIGHEASEIALVWLASGPAGSSSGFGCRDSTGYFGSVLDSVLFHLS
jgi:hypothetical protein